jgi:penicillin-binding protein 1C
MRPVISMGILQGGVSARQALRYSLNLPAVAVLDRLGPGRFTAALAAAGIRLRLPGSAYEPGLAVALGGDGITLAELLQLYAALSNGGKVASLRSREDEPASSGTAIFGLLTAAPVLFKIADLLGPSRSLSTAPPPSWSAEGVCRRDCGGSAGRGTDRWRGEDVPL